MKIVSRAVVVTRDDIDTDQIIPARFLKTTSRTGLGAHLFADWPDRPARGREILVAGKNFGCGSSREHAAWALTDFGFRAIVAPSFADIFAHNAVKNRLLPVASPRRFGEDEEITIDLTSCTIQGEPFPIDPFARRCLLAGLDELDYLLSLRARVEEHERRRL
jgi:3-isopropylmalate/(R)-2-methylmalate dehydratase small subunit